MNQDRICYKGQCFQFGVKESRSVSLFLKAKVGDAFKKVGNACMSDKAKSGWELCLLLVCFKLLHIKNEMKIVIIN